MGSPPGVKENGMESGIQIKEPFEQLPLFPCYRIKGTNYDFFTLQEAAEHQYFVTPDPDHALIRRPGKEKKAIYKERSKELHAGTYTRPTFCKEIVALPPEPSPNICSLYSSTSGKKKMRVEVLAQRCVEALMYSIQSQWDNSKVHIMPHSSGYDTRLITGILRNLRKKNGDEWLGTVLFYCFEPEIAYAKKIFDYMEWPKDWWIPVREGVGPVDYYAEVMDFSIIGKLYCEAERLWLGPVLAKLVLEERGYTDDLIGISALFGDETCKWNRLRWNDLGFFLACYFFDNPSPWLGSHVKFMFPFASKWWLHLLTEYRIPDKVDLFKLEMLKVIDPKLTDPYKLPNYRFILGPELRERGFHDYQRISSDTVRNMTKRFRESWYCNIYKKEDVLPFGNVLKYYDSRNTEYIKAAVYENLLERGCKLNGKYN